MTIIYNTLIYLYFFASAIASVFSKKAALFYRGRLGLMEGIAAAAGGLQEGERLWVHCASVGEFEQARPIIERYREQFKERVIILTFFSPSGYELRKSYNKADLVFYLPLDTRRNAERFIDIIKPTTIIFVKYEFWRNYLNVIRERQIPLYLVSAIFRESQPFFKKWGGFFRSMLNSFEHIFVQDENSRILLSGIGFNNVTVSGDTRFDRVWEVSLQKGEIEPLEYFSRGNRCLIAGSTWPADNRILADYLESRRGVRPGVRLIIAPHEVHETGINEIIDLFSGFAVIRYSAVFDNPVQHTESLRTADVLIIDTIGLLSAAYLYGSVAYIGGGFGSGIHNTLEAATFGIPVIFGPRYAKFREAKELIALGGAFSINSAVEFRDRADSLFRDNILLEISGRTCLNYVKGNLGATDAFFSKVFR